MSKKLIAMARQNINTANNPWFQLLPMPQRREIADAVIFLRSPEGRGLSKIALARAIIEKFKLKVRPASISESLGDIPHGKEAETIIGVQKNRTHEKRPQGSRRNTPASAKTRQGKAAARENVAGKQVQR